METVCGGQSVEDPVTCSSGHAPGFEKGTIMILQEPDPAFDVGQVLGEVVVFNL